MSSSFSEADYSSSSSSSSVRAWFSRHISFFPSSSLGWYRAGVGFYNRQQFGLSVECFYESVALDPLNYNCYQLMARALIALNRRSEAIAALKKSVKLDNPSDWQLLIELTNQAKSDSNTNNSSNTSTDDTMSATIAASSLTNDNSLAETVKIS